MRENDSNRLIEFLVSEIIDSGMTFTISESSAGKWADALKIWVDMNKSGIDREK